jgi:hypothetical protein
MSYALSENGPFWSFDTQELEHQVALLAAANSIETQEDWDIYLATLAPEIRAVIASVTPRFLTP